MEHTNQIHEWMIEDLKYLRSVFYETKDIAIHYEIDSYHNGEPTVKPIWIFLHLKDKALIYGRGESLKVAIENLKGQLERPQRDIWDLL